MDKNDSCSAVEKELERVLSKFTAIRGHSERMLTDVTKEFEELKSALEAGQWWCSSPSIERLIQLRVLRPPQCRKTPASMPAS